MEKNNKKLLIYPEIGEYHNFEHILLIDDTVPSYQIFVDSVNSHTFPIVYSTKSSKKELLEELAFGTFVAAAAVSIWLVLVLRCGRVYGFVEIVVVELLELDLVDLIFGFASIVSSVWFWISCDV